MPLDATLTEEFSQQMNSSILLLITCIKQGYKHPYNPTSFQTSTPISISPIRKDSIKQTCTFLNPDDSRSVQLQNYYRKLKLLMSVQQDHCSKKTSILCSECTLFYGSESYAGLCSSCYKKTSSTKKEECAANSPAETSTPMSVAEKEVIQSMEQLSLQPEKREQKDRKRCFDCNKKVGLLGIECKCSYVYCNSHRLPQYHKCEFDHKERAKDRLRKEVIKVYNGKIAEI